MYKILQTFLLKVFSNKFLFYNLISLLFLIFDLIDLFILREYIKNLPIIVGSCIAMVIIGQIFILAQWRFIEKVLTKKFLVILVFSLMVHLFALYYLHCVRESSETKKFLIQFEQIVICLSSFGLLNNKKMRIFIMISVYAFLCYEWGVFSSDLLFSIICSFVLFLLILHQDNSFNDHHQNISLPEFSNTTSMDKLSKFKSRSIQFLPNQIESPIKVNSPSCFGKTQYSSIIVNAIKEGFVVFDHNFRIKWHNSYLTKLMNSEQNEDLEKKLFTIKQDEKFSRIQSNFLKSKSQYTELFKAFQTKIKPLKSLLDHDYSEHSEKQSPLLSSRLKSKELSRCFSQSFTNDPIVMKSKPRYLNKNVDYEFEMSQKLVEVKTKTMSDYLKEMILGMNNSLRFISSEVFSFQKYNMYGSYWDEEKLENKLFFIRFFPYKDEIVVMLKHMPENDVVVAAMNDAISQNKLFASMCHELRTPLNYMTNILEIMQSDLKGKQCKLKDNVQENNHQEYLDNAIMSSKLLISSVNDFLDYFSVSSNIFTLNTSDFNLKNLMTECFLLFNFLAEKKGISYYFEYDENIPSLCYNDEKRVQQVILNLIANAFKYTNTGSIILKARKKTVCDLIQISINDTGTGIPIDLLRNLGKISPNSSSSSTTGGFGLCISNHLVNYIGPSNYINYTEYKSYYKGLKARSEVNKGTKFSFLIPCQKKLVNEKMKKEASIQMVSIAENKENDIILGSNDTVYKFLEDKTVKDVKSKTVEIVSSLECLNNCTCCKILVVDDNQFNLFVLKEKFKKNEIPIDLAQSGDEAIQIVINALNGEKFCKECKFYKLILMDIDMPYKNGYETTKELINMFKKHNINTPIVALSAFGQTESTEMALEAGMQEFIEKPLTQTKFDYVVKKFIENEE